MPLRQRRRTYFAEFNDSAKTPSRKYISLRTKDEREARIRYNHLLQDVEMGRFDPWKGNVRLSEVIRQYVEARLVDWSRATRRTNVSILRLMCEQLGDPQIAYITPDDLENFLDSRELNDVSRETYQRHLRRTRRITRRVLSPLDHTDENRTVTASTRSGSRDGGHQNMPGGWGHTYRGVGSGFPQPFVECTRESWCELIARLMN